MNRDKHEAALSAAIAGAFAAILLLLSNAFKKHPSEDKLTAELWLEAQSLLVAAMTAVLVNIYLDAANEELGKQGGGIDEAELSQAALEWASAYAVLLAISIISTTTSAVKAALKSYADGKINLDQFYEQLARILGVTRSVTIAITETTTAIIEGAKKVIEWLRRLGTRLVGYVETAADDRVCGICSPKHKQPVIQAGAPPFHPRCRCAVIYERESYL